MTYRPAKKITEFIDAHGDVRVVQRHATGRLAIKRKSPALVDVLAGKLAKHVGLEVRRVRMYRAMTMSELAVRAGLAPSKQRIREIETGTGGGVKLGTLFALARALNVPAASLLPKDADLFGDPDVQAAARKRAPKQ